MTANGEAMVVPYAPGPGLAKADLGTRFSDEQRRLILDTCCGGAPAHEAEALIAIAEARGLNPVLGECYFVKRYDSQAKRDKWSVQASIDSLRIKAEQTGLYAGQDEPTFEYDAEGNVALARVKVWRKDWERPAVGVARWEEYVQLTREQKPTKFWAQMPHNQLAKCAEALALRKAFPAVLAKIYVAEEMDQADNEVAPAPRQMAAKSAAALPAGPASGGAVFKTICGMVDAVERKAALNAVAAETKRAKASGQITESDYAAIVKACKKKAEMLDDKPSEPRPAPVDDDAERAAIEEES